MEKGGRVAARASLSKVHQGVSRQAGKCSIIEAEGECWVLWKGVVFSVSMDLEEVQATSVVH